MKEPQAILVTGCAGFIGSNFVKVFKARYPKVRIVGVDNLSSGRRDAVDADVVFVRGSILNEKLLDDTFAKYRPEYVFHFAALPRVAYSVERPRETSEVNIIGLITLLEVSRRHGIRRFINSSSSSVYGGAKTLPTIEKENPADPRSPYAVQKYAGEHFCRIYCELHGLDSVSLRYFNVFGPGQYGDSAYSTVVSGFLESLYFPHRKKGFIEGDGKQSRDFCYVDNVISANILAMTCEKPLRGAAINIGNGEQTTVLEVWRLVEHYTNKKLVLERRPARKGDVRHTRADIRMARRLLGYRPEVSFEEGLRRTVAWFQARKK